MSAAASTPTVLPPSLGNLQKAAILLGAVAGVGTVAGAFLEREDFFQAYLFGYLFWVGIAAGSFAVMMIHHLTGGAWGFSIQRVLEASARTLPLMALLFIPLLFGLKDLYLWARPEAASDHLLHQKAAYLNEPFFIVRTALYFGVWILLAGLLTRWSLRQDENSSNTSFTHKMVVLSGPGLVIYVLTMTFASFDWMMSLEPHWFSTIYGVLVIVGQGLSTFAFSIIILMLLAPYKPLSDFVDAEKFHDLGKLLLAFTMLWAYMMLSQYLIIWSANLPEEITWYLVRSQNGWEVVSGLLVAGHFIIPFLVLLSRHTKRRPHLLAAVAAFILLMRFVDLYWLVKPTEHHPQLTFGWLYLVAPLGIGGIWLTAFLWNLKSRSLLPSNDPRFLERQKEALHGSH